MRIALCLARLLPLTVAAVTMPRLPRLSPGIRQLPDPC
jgi:hypothetical protein